LKSPGLNLTMGQTSMAAKSNSLIRRYAKLQKLHDEIMRPIKNKGRQCVHTVIAKKKYDKTFRQIVSVENEDAKFIYAQT